MADEPKQINFTIVPDEGDPSTPRTPCCAGAAPDPVSRRIYANFCAIAHTPFDFTLTFCEVMPLSEKDVKAAEADHVVKAPVRAKIVVPVQFMPQLVQALQEHVRLFSEAQPNQGWVRGGPIH